MKALTGLDVYQDAEFYDEEFSGRDTEIPFYLKHARNADGPVLEVACGTGRLTLPLARTGLDITGVDISGAMLEQARRKAAVERLTVTWIEQDCRELRFNRPFALIFSAANAMQHLHDLESVNAFLTSARNSLQSSGALILDVFNPNPVKLARTATTRYLHKMMVHAGDEIRVEAASHYRAAEQLLCFTLFYLRQGILIRTKEVEMRCFFPQELAALCASNGLDIVDRYGDYDETPFSNESPKQILLCQARKGFCA